MSFPLLIGHKPTRRPFTPASLASTVLLLPSSGTFYTTSAGTTAAVPTDPVGRWLTGKSGTPDALQATAANRMVRTAKGIKVGDATDYLSLASAVVLTGDFTAYVAGSLVDVNAGWSPFCNEGGNDVFVLGQGDTTYFNSQLSSAATSTTTNGTVGDQLVRLTRSGNDLFHDVTGKAEVQLTGVATGNVTISRVGSWDVAPNANANETWSIVVVTGDIRGTADDVAIRAWFLSTCGVAL